MTLTRLLVAEKRNDYSIICHLTMVRYKGTWRTCYNPRPLLATTAIIHTVTTCPIELYVRVYFLCWQLKSTIKEARAKQRETEEATSVLEEEMCSLKQSSAKLQEQLSLKVTIFALIFPSPIHGATVISVVVAVAILWSK